MLPTPINSTTRNTDAHDANTQQTDSQEQLHPFIKVTGIAAMHLLKEKQAIANPGKLFSLCREARDTLPNILLPPAFFSIFEDSRNKTQSNSTQGNEGSASSTLPHHDLNTLLKELKFVWHEYFPLEPAPPTQAQLVNKAFELLLGKTINANTADPNTLNQRKPCLVKWLSSTTLGQINEESLLWTLPKETLHAIIEILSSTTLGQDIKENFQAPLPKKLLKEIYKQLRNAGLDGKNFGRVRRAIHYAFLKQNQLTIIKSEDSNYIDDVHNAIKHHTLKYDKDVLKALAEIDDDLLVMGNFVVDENNLMDYVKLCKYYTEHNPGNLKYTNINNNTVKLDLNNKHHLEHYFKIAEIAFSKDWSLIKDPDVNNDINLNKNEHYNKYIVLAEISVKSHSRAIIYIHDKFNTIQNQTPAQQENFIALCIQSAEKHPVSMASIHEFFTINTEQSFSDYITIATAHAKNHGTEVVDIAKQFYTTNNPNRFNSLVEILKTSAEKQPEALMWSQEILDLDNPEHLPILLEILEYSAKANPFFLSYIEPKCLKNYDFFKKYFQLCNSILEKTQVNTDKQILFETITQKLDTNNLLHLEAKIILHKNSVKPSEESIEHELLQSMLNGEPLKSIPVSPRVIFASLQVRDTGQLGPLEKALDIDNSPENFSKYLELVEECLEYNHCSLEEATKQLDLENQEHFSYFVRFAQHAVQNNPDELTWVREKLLGPDQANQANQANQDPTNPEYRTKLEAFRRIAEIAARPKSPASLE